MKTHKTGLRIGKGKNWDQIRRDNERDTRCTACSGSGWYDAVDRRGRHIKCGACQGTGKDKP